MASLVLSVILMLFSLYSIFNGIIMGGVLMLTLSIVSAAYAMTAFVGGVPTLYVDTLLLIVSLFVSIGMILRRNIMMVGIATSIFIASIFEFVLGIYTVASVFLILAGILSIVYSTLYWINYEFEDKFKKIKME